MVAEAPGSTVPISQNPSPVVGNGTEVLNSSPNGYVSVMFTKYAVTFPTLVYVIVNITSSPAFAWACPILLTVM